MRADTDGLSHKTARDVDGDGMSTFQLEDVGSRPGTADVGSRLELYNTDADTNTDTDTHAQTNAQIQSMP
jgi:hypothetical protein